jgi:hypothetical protein
MDNDARLALVGTAGIPQVKMRAASKVRILSPRSGEGPRKARVPGFLGVYESGVDTLLREPARFKLKLLSFLEAGAQGSGGVCKW